MTQEQDVAPGKSIYAQNHGKCTRLHFYYKTRSWNLREAAWIALESPGVTRPAQLAPIAALRALGRVYPGLAPWAIDGRPVGA